MWVRFPCSNCYANKNIRYTMSKRQWKYKWFTILSPSGVTMNYYEVTWKNKSARFKTLRMAKRRVKDFI